MPERDEIDGMLDAALTTYADPGPNLAPRIVEQVTIALESRNRWKRWLWAAAGLAFATAATLLTVTTPWRNPVPHPAPKIEANVAPLPVTPALTDAPQTQHRAVERRPRTIGDRPHRAQIQIVPKQETFPAPRPLSAEEETLARFVAQSSDEEVGQFAAMQTRAAEPIHISVISIPPISSPAEGKE